MGGGAGDTPSLLFEAPPPDTVLRSLAFALGGGGVGVGVSGAQMGPDVRSCMVRATGKVRGIVLEEGPEAASEGRGKGREEVPSRAAGRDVYGQHDLCVSLSKPDLGD